jgi:quercetin dioxygenase-like cupin family protein
LDVVENMNVFRYDKVKLEKVETVGASKVKVRWLITKEMGAKNFAMRIFEIEPNGFTPLHTHSWEHEVFILEGEGQLFDSKKVTPFKAEDVIFIQADEWHQFKNTGKADLKFICLIPNPKD